jgi:hypothetical protein
MTYLLDVILEAFRALGGGPWLGVAISIALWCVLSFVAAITLGRMIRRADRLAGIYDEALHRDHDELVMSDAELAYGPFVPASVARERREPTRSGPFAIEGKAASPYRSRAAGGRR